MAPGVGGALRGDAGGDARPALGLAGGADGTDLGRGVVELRGRAGHRRAVAVDAVVGPGHPQAPVGRRDVEVPGDELLLVEHGGGVVDPGGGHPQDGGPLEDLGAGEGGGPVAHPAVELVAVAHPDAGVDVAGLDEVVALDEAQERLGVLGAVGVEADPAVGAGVDRRGLDAARVAGRLDAHEGAHDAPHGIGEEVGAERHRLQPRRIDHGALGPGPAPRARRPGRPPRRRGRPPTPTCARRPARAGARARPARRSSRTRPAP